MQVGEWLPWALMGPFILVGLVLILRTSLAIDVEDCGGGPLSHDEFLDSLGALGFRIVSTRRHSLRGVRLLASIGPTRRPTELAYHRSGEVIVELTMPTERSLRVSIRATSLLEEPGTKVVPIGPALAWAPDDATVLEAFAKYPAISDAVTRVFDRGVTQILIWDGRLKAVAPARRMRPIDYRDALEDLDAIARAFEPVPLQVRVLGGERKALPGLNGRARCAYCHDGITGEEPDLVACPSCATVLHEGCWSEMKRCPVFGCSAKEPERRATRERT